MPRNKKETVQFTLVIPAGTNQTLSYVIKDNATVQRIFGKFYAGQANALQVRPYLEMTGGRAEELVTYAPGTNRYLCGDDRVYDMDIDFDVRNGDQIKVYANNTAGVGYDYTLEIAFEVDYVGGTQRVV